MKNDRSYSYFILLFISFIRCVVVRFDVLSIDGYCVTDCSISEQKSVSSSNFGMVL